MLTAGADGTLRVLRHASATRLTPVQVMDAGACGAVFPTIVALAYLPPSEDRPPSQHQQRDNQQQRVHEISMAEASAAAELSLLRGSAVVATASGEVRRVSLRDGGDASGARGAFARGHGAIGDCPAHTVMATAPYGGLALSAGQDGLLRCWDAEQRTPLACIQLGGPVSCLALMPDKRLVAAGFGAVPGCEAAHGMDGTLALLRAPSPRLVGQCKLARGPLAAVCSLDRSPPTVAALSQGGSLHLLAATPFAFDHSFDLPRMATHAWEALPAPLWAGRMPVLDAARCELADGEVWAVRCTPEGSAAARCHVLVAFDAEGRAALGLPTPSDEEGEKGASEGSSGEDEGSSRPARDEPGIVEVGPDHDHVRYCEWPAHCGSAAGDAISPWHEHAESAQPGVHAAVQSAADAVRVQRSRLRPSAANAGVLVTATLPTGAGVRMVWAASPGSLHALLEPAERGGAPPGHVAWPLLGALPPSPLCFWRRPDDGRGVRLFANDPALGVVSEWRVSAAKGAHPSREAALAAGSEARVAAVAAALAQVERASQAMEEAAEARFQASTKGVEAADERVAECEAWSMLLEDRQHQAVATRWVAEQTWKAEATSLWLGQERAAEAAREAEEEMVRAAMPSLATVAQAAARKAVPRLLAWQAEAQRVRSIEASRRARSSKRASLQPGAGVGAAAGAAEEDDAGGDAGTLQPIMHAKYTMLNVHEVVVDKNHRWRPLAKPKAPPPPPSTDTPSEAPAKEEDEESRPSTRTPSRARSRSPASRRRRGERRRGSSRSRRGRKRPGSRTPSRPPSRAHSPATDPERKADRQPSEPDPPQVASPLSGAGQEGASEGGGEGGGEASSTAPSQPDPPREATPTDPEVLARLLKLAPPSHVSAVFRFDAAGWMKARWEAVGSIANTEATARDAVLRWLYWSSRCLQAARMSLQAVHDRRVAAAERWLAVRSVALPTPAPEDVATALAPDDAARVQRLVRAADLRVWTPREVESEGRRIRATLQRREDAALEAGLRKPVHDARVTLACAGLRGSLQRADQAGSGSRHGVPPPRPPTSTGRQEVEARHDGERRPATVGAEAGSGAYGRDTPDIGRDGGAADSGEGGVLDPSHWPASAEARSEAGPAGQETPASPLSSATAARGSLTTAERKRKRRERLAARRAGRVGVGFATAPGAETPSEGASDQTPHPALSEAGRGQPPRSQTTRGSLLTRVSRLLPVDLLAGARPHPDGLGEHEEEEEAEAVGTANPALASRARNSMLPASDGRDMLCVASPSGREAWPRALGRVGHLASTPRAEQWRRAAEAWTAARSRALGWPHRDGRGGEVGLAAPAVGTCSGGTAALYPTSSTARSVESACGALRAEWDPEAGLDSRWRGLVVVSRVSPGDAASSQLRRRELVSTAVTARHGVLAASAESVDAVSDVWGASAVVAVLAHDALRTLSLHALPGAQERARVVLSPAPVSGVLLRPASAGNELLLLGDGLLEVATVRSLGAGLAVEPGVSPLCDVACSAVDMGARGSHQLALHAAWVRHGLAVVGVEDGSLWLVGPAGHMQVVETGLPFAVSALHSTTPVPPEGAVEQSEEEGDGTWRVLGTVTAHAGPVTALSVWRREPIHRGGEDGGEADAVVATGGLDGAACAFALVLGRGRDATLERTYVAAVRVVAGSVSPGTEERRAGEVGQLDTVRQWLEREMAGRESLLPHFRRRRATLPARAWAALVVEAVARSDHATSRVKNALRDTADVLASRGLLRPTASERIACALHTTALVEERERVGADTTLAPWLLRVAAGSGTARASVQWQQNATGRLASIGVVGEEDSGLGWAWSQGHVDTASGLCDAARKHLAPLDSNTAASAGREEAAEAGAGLGPALPSPLEGSGAGSPHSELNVAATARVACARPVSAEPAPDEPAEGGWALEGPRGLDRFLQRSALPRPMPRGHAAWTGPSGDVTGVVDVAVHPDGEHWVSVGGDSVARAWASQEGRLSLLWSLSLPGPAHACALGRAGPSLVVAAARRGDEVPMLLLIDWAQRGRLVDAVSPAGLEGCVHALAVSWDGSLVVAATQRGDALALALQEGQLRPIVSLPVPGGSIARHGVSLSLNHALCRVRGEGEHTVATYDPVSGAPVPATSAAEGQVWVSWRHAWDAALALGADIPLWAQRHGAGSATCGAFWRVHADGRERVVVACGTDTGLVVLGIGAWRPARTTDAAAQMMDPHAGSGGGSGSLVLVEAATTQCVEAWCVRVGPATCAVRAVALGGKGCRLSLLAAAAGCDLVTASLDVSGTRVGGGDGVRPPLVARPVHGGSSRVQTQPPGVDAVRREYRPTSSAAPAVPVVREVTTRSDSGWMGAVVHPWGGPSFALRCPRRPEIGLANPLEAAGASARCSAPLAPGHACCVVATRRVVASLWLEGAVWRVQARDAAGGELLLTEHCKASSAEAEAAADGDGSGDRVTLSVGEEQGVHKNDLASCVVQCFIELGNASAWVTRVERQWVLGPHREVSFTSHVSGNSVDK